MEWSRSIKISCASEEARNQIKHHTQNKIDGFWMWIFKMKKVEFTVSHQSNKHLLEFLKKYKT